VPHRFWSALIIIPKPLIFGDWAVLSVRFLRENLFFQVLQQLISFKEYFPGQVPPNKMKSDL